jgi:hypothetical protein
MKKELRLAINSIKLATEVEDTAIVRVYLAYPLDFTTPLAIDVTGVPASWVVKCVASILNHQVNTQEDKSVGRVYAECIRALHQLAENGGINATVEVMPTKFYNMENVSGIVCDELTDFASPDGQWNPKVTVVSAGEQVWSDYVGFLFL